MHVCSPEPEVGAVGQGCETSLEVHLHTGWVQGNSGHIMTGANTRALALGKLRAVGGPMSAREPQTTGKVAGCVGVGMYRERMED